MLKYFPILFLFPYIFGFSPTDTSFTDISVGGGIGNYIHNDCNGFEKRTFIDGGVNFSTRMKGPVRIGGTIGGFAETKQNGGGFPIIYPELSLDFNSFALGSTGLRIGYIDSYYAQFGIFNSAPVLTGKGAINAGFNFPMNPPLSRLWIGGNVFPYNSWGVVVQPEFALSENKFLFVTGRYGTYKNDNEWGVSIGIRLRK